MEKETIMWVVLGFVAVIVVVLLIQMTMMSLTGQPVAASAPAVSSGMVGGC